MQTPNSSSLLKRPATFFCRLNYIEFIEPIGPGAEFSDGFFITNDRATIENIVDWKFFNEIGSLEFRHLMESAVMAYRKLENVEEGRDQKALVDSLLILNSFEECFWLHADSCVGHEAAFIKCGSRVSSNYYGGIRSLANSEQKTLTLKAGELRSIVKLYSTKLAPNFNKAPIMVHTKTNSTRISRTLSYVSRAQMSVDPAEKIAFYCTALETLFSTSQSELAHQIAERVAVISSQDAGARNDRYWFVKECYTTRSKYLHGSPQKDSAVEDIFKKVSKLDDLVRSSIHSALSDRAFMSALESEKSLDEFMIRKILGITSYKT